MTYHIKGKVNSSTTEYFNCTTFSKLYLRVCRSEFGSLTELLDQEIGADGSFDFNVATTAGSIVVKLLCLYSDDAGEVLVAQSDMFCHHDTIEIQFDFDEHLYSKNIYDEVSERLTEHMTVKPETIAPLSDAQLKELSCLTCVSVNTLKRFQAAYRLFGTFLDFDDTLYTETEADINHFKDDADTSLPMLFALNAKSLHSSLTATFAYSDTQFETIINEAVSRHEINGDLATAEVRARLIHCRNGLLLNANDDASCYDAKLIHLSNNNYADKTDLLNGVLDSGGLRSLIPSSPTMPSDPLRRVIPLITLDEHLMHFPPMLDIAVNNVVIGDNPDYYELTLEGSELWESIVLSYPSVYSSAGAYVKAIYDSISESSPSARLSKNLDTSGLSNAASLKAVLDNFRDFNINEHSASSYFSRVETDPNYLAPATLSELQALQRSVKLSDDKDNLVATKVMLQNDLASSYAVTRQGKESFVSLLTTNGVAADRAEKIYCRAAHMNSTISMLMAQYMRYENPEAVLPSKLKNPEYSGSTLPNMPDLESLFGSLNTCNCSDCQSVYSPAAYLTDLLHWLGTSVSCAPGQTGFDALMRSVNLSATTDRRVDIRYLNLNCKNTNTLVPYIDLVNEILSVNLLRDVPGYTGTDITNAYKALQTTRTAEELLTEPEHRFPDAENLLKGSYFQWALPYDSRYDEATSYLKQLDKPYADLIRDFSSEIDQYDTSHWANALLQLNSTEAGLIGNSQSGVSNFWKTFWGLTSADLTDNAASPATPGVGAVMKSAALTLNELKEILSAFYINGSDKLTIVPHPGDECDIDHYTFSPKFTISIADRFMRFVRLKRKTGLSVQELDLAIANHSPSNGIDAAFLKKLASCLAFARTYKLSFSDVESFWSEQGYNDLFNTTSRSDYFKNKFLNALLPADILSFYTSDLYTIQAFDLTNADKQKLAKIFNVSIPAVESIVRYALSGNPVISLTELAIIQRYAILINSFGIDASEFRNVITLCGDPFSSGNIHKSIWEFASAIRDFYSLGIKSTELIPLVEGDQIYDLNSSELDSRAKAGWEKLEAAYKKGLEASPEKEFDASSSYLPVLPADQAYFEDLIADHLRLSFGLNLTDTKKVVNAYLGTWLRDYVKDPQGKLAQRSWTNRKAAFKPVFRILERISRLSEVCGLDDSGISAGVEIELGSTIAIPSDNFYWMSNTFRTMTLSDLTWIKKATRQASLLDIPQASYFNVADDLLNHDAMRYSNPPADDGITDLFSSLGGSSLYKDLTVFEFTQTFLRARIIANGNKDLVKVMDTFEAIFLTVQTLGYNVSDGWSWVWNSSSTARVDISNYSADIRRVLHNKFPDFKAWSEVIVPIQNGLRSRLRDALVAFYIGTRDYKNENAIYAYYLLDTQMAPCNQTSRVVAAISSTQLLVHRALLGLEPQVCMIDDDRSEWEWRKNYRVWEANRKVFLYPENWIDPSLRSNKTMLFRSTEDLLQQDEINQQNSENAFASYLTGLSDVAHLDVRATYMEQPEGPIAYRPGKEAPPETLHVFARSWNPPYVHYYRSLKNNAWTAWEKMDLETDSDHLIPIMFNRKLYVFFPVFVEKQHQFIKNKVAGQEVGAGYLEVKMAYTRLDFGKWSGKKVLDGVLYAGTLAGPNMQNNAVEGLANRLARAYAPSRENVYSTLPNYTYRGNMVWDCPGAAFQGFAPVSLKKEAFYFWPQVDVLTGDLTIHCRRDFDESYENYHDGYTELAYEWGFRIGACDEKVTIVPPVVTEASPTAQRFLARPYMTLPYYQQLKRGRDKPGFDPANPGNDGGLWAKTSVTFSAGSNKILKKTNGDYVLTYPAQYKNNMTGQPFFYADKRHSLYVNPNSRVSLHEHPFTCKMLEALNRLGIEGLLNSKDVAGLKRQAASIPFFAAEYDPASSIPTPYPVQEYDFSPSGAYSIYNWEVFFHTVSLIARQLRLSNKFEDAVKWINYIFDPTNRDMSLQDLRYWKLKPFLIDVTKGISYYMRLLSAPNLSAAEKAEKKQWEEQIAVWRDHPFDPHLIASMRPRAYMIWTVMELIETLSDWGDYLFRQDTTESINEAINLYVLASEILGERPKKVDRPAPADFNFNDVMGGLNAFSNASANFENYMTSLNLCSCTENSNGCSNSPALTTLPELIFCIPDNPKMTELWDRVEDRLYKIRNCMNIDGKKRQLALFAPPIDPALLVRATAMGLDLSDVLADLAAAPPHYRFQHLLQRATEFTGEVKSLGAQLLTALEKKDAEELSLLRQLHEQNILKAGRTMKEMQLEEAKQSYTTLQYSKNLIQIRLDDYKNREYKNSREENALRQTQIAEGLMMAEQSVRAVGGLLNLIPDLYVGTASSSKVFGGDKIANVANGVATCIGIISAVNRNKASMSLTYAGYDRRQEDWDLQIKSASEELQQVDRQLLSAEIRIAIAEKELASHDLQAAQSAEVYDWMKSKYSNQALYTWMAGQLKTLYRKAYDLAYDMAKLAQQAFFKDLGTDDAAKITFGNWDSSRAGFFAGERLSIQLRELEAAYMQHNTRDLELSKNISLALLDPLALEDLKTKGYCDINLPELLFDLDYPGHYHRQIRSVALSIPGIAGPYSTIAATLTLNSHAIRKTAQLGALSPQSGYGESIATSSAQNDSGVFELNFRDERYMPFEHKGAVSSWRLELSQIERSAKETIRLFDFNTISDVIMHLSYSAKYDGAFAASVKADVDAGLSSLAAAINGSEGMMYAINLRHDMPDAWHQLKSTGSASLKIEKSRLPYLIQAMSPAVGNVSVIAYTKTGTASSCKINVGTLAPLTLSKVSGTSVYKSSGAAGIALNSNFSLGTIGISSGALSLSDTEELVLVVKISVA